MQPQYRGPPERPGPHDVIVSACTRMLTVLCVQVSASGLYMIYLATSACYSVISLRPL